MERIEWQVREYRCKNGVCCKTKFPVWLEGADREGTRRYSRKVKRAERLTAESARELALKLNNNFEAGRDHYMTLDYSEEGMDGLICRAGTNEADALYASAEAEMANYVKRLRRACKAAGVELKYAYVTSDMDGETYEPVRVHHHLVINEEAAKIAEKCWKAGGAKRRELYGPHGDLAELAEYMIKQTRQAPGKHRYHPSRTLEMPEASKPTAAKNPDAPLRVPTGCSFIWRSESYAGRPQVLRYWRPPEKRKKRKKGK